MKLTLMLCDHAATAEGKLYINGGGWNLTGPDPSPSAIAILVEVPWTDADRRINLALRLFHEDGAQVGQQTSNGPAPVEVNAEFAVGRPADSVEGAPLPVPLAINLPPLQLPAGTGFYWQAELDNESHSDWRLSFRTRAAKAGPPTVSGSTDPTSIPGL